MTEIWALVLAFVFGCVYNWLIARWGRSGYGGGLTGIWVALGVAGTLAISALVQTTTIRLHFTWQGEALVLTNAQHAALFELRFFIATGTPMLYGSLRRFFLAAI